MDMKTNWVAHTPTWFLLTKILFRFGVGQNHNLDKKLTLIGSGSPCICLSMYAQSPSRFTIISDHEVYYWESHWVQADFPFWTSEDLYLEEPGWSCHTVLNFSVTSFIFLQSLCSSLLSSESYIEFVCNHFTLMFLLCVQSQIPCEKVVTTVMFMCYLMMFPYCGCPAWVGGPFNLCQIVVVWLNKLLLEICIIIIFIISCFWQKVSLHGYKIG